MTAARQELDALRARLAVTEARLAEAEETLAAIRNGEIDGLVVAGPHGDQVFTLKGADHPYRVMLEAMEEGAATLGADGTILFCNRRFAAMLRLPREHVLGAPITRFIAPDGLTQFADLLTIARQRSAREEIVLRTGADMPVPISLACSALPDDEPGSVCLVATDLTRQKITEAAIFRLNNELEARVKIRTTELARANATLRDEMTRRLEADRQLTFQAQVLDKVAQAVIATDLTMTVQYWNHAAEVLYGWSSADAVGRNAFELLSPRASEAQGREIMAALTRGESWRGEYLVQNRHGRTFPVEATDTPFFAEDGTLIGIIGVSSDITARKQAEAALRQLAQFPAENPNPVLRVASDGALLFANDAARRMLNAMEVRAEASLPAALRALVTETFTTGTSIVKELTDRHGRLFEILATRPVGESYANLYGRDITERKQAEEALRESEQTFAAAFHHNASAMVLTRIADGTVLDANAAWLRLTGFTRDAVLGKPARDHGGWKNLRDRDAMVEMLAEQGYVHDLECPCVRHNGEEYTVLMSAQTITVRGEAVLLASSLDITARKRAEEALRESETRYKMLFHGFPISTVVFQMTGNDWVIVDYNKESLAFTGGRIPDFVGKKARDIYHAYPEILAAFSLVSQNHISQRLEIPYRRISTDDEIYLRLTLAFVAPDKILVHSEDITARKQTEEALQELTQRLTYHVDNSPLAVIEWGPDMRLTRWSGEAERIFGWTAEEVLGKRMEDFRWIYQEDVTQVAEVSDELQTGTNPRRFSANRNYCKDGSVVSCEWYNSSLVDASGQLRSILSLVLDVTAQKQLEESLRAADRAKDEFLAIISHELQTPLTNMLGWSTEALRDGSPELMAQAMTIVQRNAVRQKRLVNDILDMSRLIHRKIELIPEPTDLWTQTEHAVENVLHVAAERQLTLHLIPPTEPLPLAADPARLQQCIGNLLHNSLKFTPAGGSITVQCCRADAQAVLTIADTGCGIDPAELPALFEVFRQVERNERHGGLGLEAV